MPRHPEVKPDWYEKKIYWEPRAADGFATCFTVVFSGPEVEPSGWVATAGQQQYPAHPVWHTELPKDGKMVWLLGYEQPLSEEDREGIDELRQLWPQFLKSAMGDANYAALADPRGWLYAADAHGTRFFIDISLPS